MIHLGIHKLFFTGAGHYFLLLFEESVGALSPPTSKRIQSRNFSSNCAGQEQASFWWSK